MMKREKVMINCKHGCRTVTYILYCSVISGFVIWQQKSHNQSADLMTPGKKKHFFMTHYNKALNGEWMLSIESVWFTLTSISQTLVQTPKQTQRVSQG